MSVKQITVRNPPPDLVRSLREVAKARGESLNATIIRVLSEALGQEERRRRLARYATWTEQDLEEFETALAAQRQVDARLWTAGDE